MSCADDEIRLVDKRLTEPKSACEFLKSLRVFVHR